MTEVVNEPHILAFEREIRDVHLDELAKEDSRDRVRFVVVALDVRDGRTNHVIHELKLAPDRVTKFLELDAIRGARLCQKLRHPYLPDREGRLILRISRAGVNG